jgi:hypothetical protein
MYNKYYTACSELFPAGAGAGGQAKASGSGSTGGGAKSSMASSIMGVQSSSSAGSEPTGAPVGLASSSVAVKAGSSSGLSSGAPAATLTASAGLGKQSSSVVPAASSSAIREGSLQEPSELVANEDQEGLLTKFQSSQSESTSGAGLIALEESSAPTKITTAPYPGPSAVSDNLDIQLASGSGSASLPATSILSGFASTPSTSASESENRLIQAMNATDLFFQHDIDKPCLQKADGCTSWQAQIKVSIDRHGENMN